MEEPHFKGIPVHYRVIPSRHKAHPFAPARLSEPSSNYFSATPGLSSPLPGRYYLPHQLDVPKLGGGNKTPTESVRRLCVCTCGGCGNNHAPSGDHGP